MALKIGVLSQKGGVAKSTLIRALAVEYAKSDWSVKIADMDLRQKTATEWNCIRLNNNHKPTLAVEPFANVKDVLKQESTYELILFDGAGQADVQTLEIGKCCDYVILPSGVTRDDLVPQIKLAHEFIKKQVLSKNQIAFVLTRVGNSNTEQDAAIEFINDAGYYCAGYIPEKTSIGKNHDYGLAANETKYQTINKTVDQLIQNIVDKINEII